MKMSELLGQLASAGIGAFVFRNVEGGEVVVTGHGGRVLGLFASEGGENLYFVNPELGSVGVKDFLAGEHVLGGDRLWVAPERGLFFRGDTLADGVTTQRGIDPGNWRVGRVTEESIRMVNEFEATYFRKAGSVVRGVVERTVRVVGNPLGGGLPKGVSYAGYEVGSRFELLESPIDELYFGMWFLIQLVVPTGAYFYAPISGSPGGGRAVITDYFEKTGADYLRVEEDHVRFKLDSMERHKIGIRKNEVMGRIGFLSGEKEGVATLVVRNFLNNPSGHYADVPLHTPGGTQDSVQSYNHMSGPEGFGELEFHSPGVNRRMAEAVVTDVNQVWAFTGRREGLVGIAAHLLNLPASVFAL